MVSMKQESEELSLELLPSPGVLPPLPSTPTPNPYIPSSYMECKHLITGDSNGNICEWDSNTGVNISQVTPRENSGIYSLCLISGESKGIIGGGESGSITVVDLREKESSIGEIGVHMGAITQVESIEEHYVVTASLDKSSCVIDLRRPEKKLCVLSTHTQAIYTVSYLGNGLLATGSKDKCIHLWDLAQPPPLKPFTTLSGHVAAVNYITPYSKRLQLPYMGGTGGTPLDTYTPDAYVPSLASTSSDGSIKLWEDCTCVQTLNVKTIVNNMCKVFDSFRGGIRTRILCSTKPNSMMILDVNDRNYMIKLNKHKGVVYAAYVLGNYVLSASADSTLIVWAVGNNDSSILDIIKNDHPIHSFIPINI